MATHNPINILEAFAAAPPPLDYVLPNMVAGTVGALVSPGGAGKSMLALQLAAQIAGGPDLLGVGELPTGPVIYLPAEDPPTAIHHRLHALGAHLSAEERQAVADGLSCQFKIVFLYGLKNFGMSDEGILRKVIIRLEMIFQLFQCGFNEILQQDKQRIICSPGQSDVELNLSHACSLEVMQIKASFLFHNNLCQFSNQFWMSLLGSKTGKIGIQQLPYFGDVMQRKVGLRKEVDQTLTGNIQSHLPHKGSSARTRAYFKQTLNFKDTQDLPHGLPTYGKNSCQLHFRWKFFPRLTVCIQNIVSDNSCQALWQLVTLCFCEIMRL